MNNVKKSTLIFVRDCESFWKLSNTRLLNKIYTGKDMIPIGVRGNKRRKDDQLKLMREIRGLLPVKKDHEIMKIMAIPNSTFYRYKSLIYKEDKELWSKAMFEPLESRALRLYESLQETSRICRKIAFDEKNKPMDRIRASKKMVNAHYNILNLLKMGPNSAKYFDYI